MGSEEHQISLIIVALVDGRDQMREEQDGQEMGWNDCIGIVINGREPNRVFQVVNSQYNCID